MTDPLLDALGADSPSADRAGNMDLYGRFVARGTSMTALHH
jgi:hypothetical protein